MNERQSLLQSMADTIADYRQGEIRKPTPDHVDKWVNQFGAPVQVPILREMAHVLGKTYIAKTEVESFLKTVITSKKFAGDDCCAFWRNVRFLNIQGGGNSQREMLDMFSAVLDPVS